MTTINFMNDKHIILIKDKNKDGDKPYIIIKLRVLFDQNYYLENSKVTVNNDIDYFCYFKNINPENSDIQEIECNPDKEDKIAESIDVLEFNSDYNKRFNIFYCDIFYREECEIKNTNQGGHASNPFNSNVIKIHTISTDRNIYYAKDRKALFYLSFPYYVFNWSKCKQIYANNIDITNNCISKDLLDNENIMITCYLDLLSIFKKEYLLINSPITIKFCFKEATFNIRRGTEYPLDL